MDEPSREIVLAYIEEAKQKKKNKEAFVRSRVEEDFPAMAGKRIKRGGKLYDAIDYLIDDIDGY